MLDDVLALVLDAALVVSEAERGFIVLAGRSGTLEFKLARGRGGVTLPDSDFRSHRVPEDVFATGHAQYFVDFPEEVPDPDQRASVALQLRSVSCLPLVAFELVDRSRAFSTRSIEARYVTLVCGQLTPDGRLAYCNVGHSPPLLVGPLGVHRLQVGGPPVGMFEAARFDEEVLVLTAGDRLVVYTDGVSEARNGTDEEFGEQRIVEVAESSPDADPAELVAALKARVQAFAAGVPQNDDITALVVAYRRTRPSGLESPQDPRIRTWLLC